MAFSVEFFSYVRLRVGLLALTFCTVACVTSPKAESPLVDRVEELKGQRIIGRILDAKQNEAEGEQFSAIALFSNVDDDLGDFYQDAQRNALAINAADARQRGVFVHSKMTVEADFPQKEYTLTLVTLGEIDGESRYQVYVNTKLIAELQNIEVDSDYTPLYFDLGRRHLSPGDTITVAAMAVTNGKIPEGDGTAYARGRWRAIMLR